MSYCEWNPEEDKPAECHLTNPEESHIGCKNEATIAVGANGQWHLCESCAKLPRFKRFRVRIPLKGGDANKNTAIEK